MLRLLIVLALRLLASPEAASPIASVPAPPGGALDPELTRIASERASVEMKAALAELERDRTRTAAEKNELKKRIGRLKVAVFTTAKSLDETVAHYEKVVPKATFIFGERDLGSDLRDGIQAGAIKAGDAAVKEAAGKRGRSARWSRQDGALEIDIEDHLLDPRDGTVTKKTVVLVTSLGD